jgi:hypothetical protein
VPSGEVIPGKCRPAAHPLAIAPDDHPEAGVLDFMNQYGPLGGRSETVGLQGSVRSRHLFSAEKCVMRSFT